MLDMYLIAFAVIACFGNYINNTLTTFCMYLKILMAVACSVNYLNKTDSY